jgi:hypothetical protein
LKASLSYCISSCRFFHQQAKRKKEKEASDNESISDDEFDEYLGKNVVDDKNCATLFD